MSLFFSKQLFAEGMVDEILLYEQAQAVLADLQYQLTTSILQELFKKQGIHLATMVLNMWLKEYKHKAFYQELAGMPVTPDLTPVPVKLLIVPGMFYKEYPELGGNGHFIRDIARRCGFDADIVETRSIGSIEGNIKQVQQAIIENSDQPLWLVSMSKGSAEVALALMELTEKQYAAVQGWVSLCGVLKGSPVADKRLRSPLRRTLFKGYAALTGLDYRGFDDLRSLHPWWSRLSLPENIEMVHLQPVPLPGYVHASLIKRYLELSLYGPNDGTLYLEDLIDYPGHVYPLWGVDHLFRDRDVIPLIYKLCHYIKNYHSKREHENEENKITYNGRGHLGTRAIVI